MFGLGTGEILVILLVVLLIFGGKRIPELAHSLGKGLREFKKAKDEFTDDIINNTTETEKNDIKN